MGLLDSLLAAAMQGTGGGPQGAAPQANPVAGALMALLTGGAQAGAGQPGAGQSGAGQPGASQFTGGQQPADDLRPPPGGKRPSMGGGMKDAMPGGDSGGMAGLGGLVSGLMGGAGSPGAAAIGGGGMGGGAMGGGALAAGLAALVQQFSQNGLGQQASSWVGSGANMPIDPQALTRAVGSDRLSMLAERYGIPREELATALAEQLPQAVNELTPHGAIPEPDAMQQMLAQFLGGGRRGGF
jgi:uncharacterized protein YidB (DUF937 family)